MGVFEVSSLRERMVLPHHHHNQSTNQILITTARRFWIPILALILTTAFLLHASPEQGWTRLALRTDRVDEVDRLSVSAGEIDWDRVSSPLPVTATIEQRLKAWQDAPQIEPADWVKKSAEVSNWLRVCD